MTTIDLNCDLGEGMENDEAIMPLISSANIACGYHAGDAAIMERTVALALLHGVAVGAHPSYPDRAHFGRIDLLEGASPMRAGAATLAFSDLSRILTDQLGKLKEISERQGALLHHVKLHGALYNRAARDRQVSAIICGTIRQFDPSLLIYGLSGSVMQAEAERCGLRFIHEVFGDRTYRENGTLTRRTEPGALIEDPELAVRQVLALVREGRVVTTGGTAIPLAAGTVCIHGDGHHAPAFARAIHEAFVKNDILINAPGK
jgi:5-oxoprolinase (ATP-hydrolysing) subunit A